jgi:hypothetical protein
VRDQYAGDVSDVIKFAFLRALAGRDRTLGIAWYSAAGHDGRTDGRHLEWRDEPKWKALDPQLHAGLSALRERSIAALEGLPIWPKDTVFHREPVPANAARNAWAEQMRVTLDSANLLFLDPDNGLGETGVKHATFSEAEMLRRLGRAIVVITFPGRSATHEVLVRKLHDRLRSGIGAQEPITLRTNVSVPRAPGARLYVQRQRWFTVIDSDAELTARAHVFAKAIASIPRVTAQLECAP